MLETVRIRRAGYNVRLTYEEFIQLYRILLPKGLVSSQKDVRDFMNTMELNKQHYQLGKCPNPFNHLTILLIILTFNRSQVFPRSICVNLKKCVWTLNCIRKSSIALLWFNDGSGVYCKDGSIRLFGRPRSLYNRIGVSTCPIVSRRATKLIRTQPLSFSRHGVCTSLTSGTHS